MLPLFFCTGANASTDGQTGKAAEMLKKQQNQDAFNAAQKLPVSGERSLISGVAALRLGRNDDAVAHLADAEKLFPLLADHAASLRAEALFRLKRHREASQLATATARSTHAPHLARRLEKLAADALLEAGDFKEALQAYRAFTTRHSLGRDSVDAAYQAARCMDLLGDHAGAIKEYREIWLKHPTSAQADKIQAHLKNLEKSGNAKANSFTAEELLQRATLVLAAGKASDAAWALAAIPRENLPDDLLAHIELKSGQAAIKQRKYTLAEKFLARSSGSSTATVRDESRLALARVEERINRPDLALARLLSLAVQKGPLADDALLGAALIHKHAGRYSEAAILFERLSREFPKSELYSRALWEMSWSRYLAGDLPGADSGFKLLLKDESYRERALYWHGKSLLKQKQVDQSEQFFNSLLKEYPFGYYSAMRREQTKTNPSWARISNSSPLPALPAGSDRILALANVGLPEEARNEIAALKGKGAEKPPAPGISRLQQMAEDFHGSIVTFHQNRPSGWDQSNVAYWALGYPRPYNEMFSRHATGNRLSEALVLSLAKAESNFMAGVKSHAGAIGLMQLMPATAKMTAGEKGKKFNPMSLVDPEFNIRLGTKHLRELLDQYHQDTVYTLAAYNAGAGAVNRWRATFGDLPRDEFIENIPYQETRDYVKKIIVHIAVYRSLYRIN